MKPLGWTRGDTDVCRWRKDTPAGPVYVAVHVDDGILAGFDVEAQIKQLHMAYKLTVNRNPSEILGLELEIAADNHGLLSISQTKHIQEVLHKWETHPDMPIPTLDVRADRKQLSQNKNIDLRNLHGLDTETDTPAW